MKTQQLFLVIAFVFMLIFTGCSPVDETNEEVAEEPIPTAKVEVATPDPILQPNPTPTDTPSPTVSPTMTTIASFVPSMGCYDTDCTDASHFHHCDEDCSEIAHYHDCPEGCVEHDHGISHHEEESHHAEHHS